MTPSELAATEAMSMLTDFFVEAMEAYIKHLKSLPPNTIPHPTTRALLQSIVDGHLKNLALVDQEILERRHSVN